MVTKTPLCLIVLLVFCRASYCPIYTCSSSLAANICASYSSGPNFSLNSNGCSSGYFCSAMATGLWADLLNGTGASSGNTLSCTPSASTSTATSVTFTSMNCGTKAPNNALRVVRLSLPAKQTLTVYC